MTLTPNANGTHAPERNGSQDPGASVGLPAWLATMNLPNDPRIGGNGRKKPDEPPVNLTGMPLTYGLAAKVLLPRPAFGFKVEHDLPMGVTLVEASPKCNVVGDHLIWNLGRVDPGQEIRLQVTVKLEEDAELKAGDMTNFTATYTQNLYFQTPLVLPKIAVKVNGPESVTAGDGATFEVEIANKGNWPVQGITMLGVLSPNLEHPVGRKLQLHVGTLLPHESRKIPIATKVIRTGRPVIQVDVTSNEGAKVSARFGTESEVESANGPAVALRIDSAADEAEAERRRVHPGR
jgi:hypothetical protein